MKNLIKKHLRIYFKSRYISGFEIRKGHLEIVVGTSRDVFYIWLVSR